MPNSDKSIIPRMILNIKTKEMIKTENLKYFPKKVAKIVFTAGFHTSLANTEYHTTSSARLKTRRANRILMIFLLKNWKK